MIVKSFCINSNKKNNERATKISDCRQAKNSKFKNKIKNSNESPSKLHSPFNKSLEKQEGFSSALL